jgi:type IV pilus assembly protein PilA
MVAIIVIVVALGLVAMIGIIAAIAVPGLLRARMAGNEATAIGSMRGIISAPAAYFSVSGGYATRFATLVCRVAAHRTSS